MGRPVAKTIGADVKFCPKCGWMMAKIGYVDVKTKQKIQKYTCPNRKCSEYNK